MFALINATRQFIFPDIHLLSNGMPIPISNNI